MCKLLILLEDRNCAKDITVWYIGIILISIFEYESTIYSLFMGKLLFIGFYLIAGISVLVIVSIAKLKAKIEEENRNSFIIKGYE